MDLKMDIETNCVKCNSAIPPGSALKCCFCDYSTHFECEDMHKDVFYILQQSRNLQWFCDSCTENKKFLINISDKLNKLNDKLAEHEKKLNSIAQPINFYQNSPLTPRKRSFVNVLKENNSASNVENGRAKIMKINQNGQNPPVQSVKAPILVIKSKKEVKKCDLEKSATNASVKIKSILNPLTDPVKSMQTRKNGKVIIQCNDSQSLENVKEKLSKKIGSEFSIEKPTERRPVLKVVGLHDYVDEETAINYIRKQNDTIITSESVLKIEQVRKRETYTTLLISTDIVTFKKVMQRRRLLIGWNSCKCWEHLEIIRCFRCQMIGHISANCSEVEVCPKCAGSHAIKNCNQEKICCVNCSQANVNLNLQLNTEHYAWSINCTVMQKRLKSVQRHVRYLE